MDSVLLVDCCQPSLPGVREYVCAEFLLLAFSSCRLRFFISRRFLSFCGFCSYFSAAATHAMTSGKHIGGKVGRLSTQRLWIRFVAHVAAIASLVLKEKDAMFCLARGVPILLGLG